MGWSGDCLTRTTSEPPLDASLSGREGLPARFGRLWTATLVYVLTITFCFRSTQAEMVNDVLVIRSPGELLVSQSELLGKSDILPYQPILGGAWSEYDIDITAGGPIQFSSVPSMIISDATDPSTRIFSLLLGKTSKKRYLVVVTKKQMTILDLHLGQDINYTVTPRRIMDQGICGSEDSPNTEPQCTFNPGSFNFLTIRNHVVFVCDIIKGQAADSPVWLTTWSIELELPAEENISSAYILLGEEEQTWCNDTKNVVLPADSEIPEENYFVLRHCYNANETRGFVTTPLTIFSVWELAREPDGRIIYRGIQRVGTRKYIKFGSRPVATEFQLIQIIVLQQVAVFVTHDFIGYQDVKYLRDRMMDPEIELKFSSAEPGSEWRRLQCNYMGPVTGCARIIGKPVKNYRYEYNLSFIEFSMYEDELVQSVTFTKLIVFNDQSYAENLRFVGFRRNLLVLCGEDSLMFNKLGGGSKAWNFTGIKVSKMVDFYFDEGPGSLLDGYVVFGFLNYSNPQAPTEEFRLAKVTVPYFHFKSYVSLAGSTCNRYLSNCTELDIDFVDEKGVNRLTKKIYLIDSTFNSLLQRQTDRRDMQIVATSEVTEIDFSNSFYGPVFQPLLSLDQTEFNSRKDLKLSKQPRNALGKVVAKNSFLMNLERTTIPGDTIEYLLPHAITMKYQKDGWKRFGLFVRYYKKPSGGRRRVFIRAIMANIPPEQKGGLSVPGSRMTWIELDDYLAAHDLNDSNTALYPVEIADFVSESSTTLLALTTSIDLNQTGHVTSRNFTFCFITINTENSPSKQVLTSEHLVRNIDDPKESTRIIDVYSTGSSALVMYLQKKAIHSFEVKPDKNYHIATTSTISFSLADFFPSSGPKALSDSDILDFKYSDNLLIVIFAGRPFGHKYHVVALINLYRSKKSGSPAGIILVEEPDYHIFFHAATNQIVVLYQNSFRIHEIDLDQDLLKTGQGSEFEPFTVASRLDFKENKDLFPLLATLKYIPNFYSRTNSHRRLSNISLVQKPYIVLQADMHRPSIRNLPSKVYLIFKLGSSHSILLNKVEIGPAVHLNMEYTYEPKIFGGEDTDLLTLVELDPNGALGQISFFQPSVTLKVDYSDFFSDDKNDATDLRFTVSDLENREFGQKLIVNRTQRFSISSPPKLSSKSNQMALEIENLGLISKVEFGCNGDSNDGIYSSRQLDSLTCITQSGTPYEVDIKRAAHHEASLVIDIHREKQVTELIPLPLSSLGSERKVFLTNADDEILVFESTGDKLQTHLVCSLKPTRAIDFTLKACPKIAHVYEGPGKLDIFIIMMCSDGFEYHMIFLALPLSEIVAASQDGMNRRLVLEPVKKIKVSESIWDAIVLREQYDVLLNRLLFLRSKVNLAGQASKYIIKVYVFDSQTPSEIRSLNLVGTSFSDKYDLGDIVNLAILAGSYEERTTLYSGYLAKYKYSKEKSLIEISLGEVFFRESTFKFDFASAQEKISVSISSSRKFSWGDVIWTPSSDPNDPFVGQLLIYMLFDDFLEEYRINLKKSTGRLMMNSRLFNGRYRYKGVCSSDGDFRVKVLEQYLTLDCVPFDSEGSTNNLIIYKRPLLVDKQQYPRGQCINPTHVLSQDIGYDSRNMENLLLKSKDGILRLLRISPHQVINQYRIYEGLQIELQSKKRSFFQKKKVSVRLSNHFSHQDLVLEFNSEPLAEQISDIVIAKKAPILVVLGWFFMVSIPWMFIAIVKSFWILRLNSLRQIDDDTFKEAFAANWSKRILDLKAEFEEESKRRKLEEPLTRADTDEYDLARETMQTTKAVRGTRLLIPKKKPSKKSQTLVNAGKQKQLMRRMLSDLVV